MNILYISQTDIDLKSYSIYSDLSNTLIAKGHKLSIVCANSKIDKTQAKIDGGAKVIQVKVANQFGVNLIKKALILLTLEGKIKKAIKKYLSNEKFDLIIYQTPPITFAGVVKYCKKKFGCKSYLMLKDIFPQNSVDLGMMKKNGLKGLIYKFFRKKEINLYKMSDKIGCMSQMNIDYLLRENKFLDANKVELFPNSAIIRPLEKTKSKDELEKLGIDKSKTVFVYGGNLGVPQGLDFFAECVKDCEKIDNAHFLIIGKGSEKEKLFSKLQNCKNATTLEFLPPDVYDKVCSQCDVGLVLLDKRFTIPNYPSRMLSYMANAKPMLACVDRNNDVPDLIENANCGRSCFSEKKEDFALQVKWFVDNKSKIKTLGENGRKYFEENFNVENYISNFEKLIKGEIK